MMMSRRGSLEYVAFLVRAGADVNACDNRGKTVLDRAYEDQCAPEMIKILIDAGAKPGKQPQNK